MRFLYNILAIILLICATPVFVTRLIRESGFGERLKQSFGFLPADALDKVAGKNCIWLHAASVGEIVATSPLIKEIRRELPDMPVLVSVVTASGYEMAKRIIPDVDGLIFFPFDLPWLARGVIKKVSPRVFLLVETELWPNFLKAAKQSGVPVMMVNGRISDKSVNNYRHLRSVLQEMLDTVVKFCMQSTIDAQYIIALGADPRRVVVTGNTKYDQTYTDVTPEERQQLIEILDLSGHTPVIVAGSTHKGEEELVYGAFNQIKQVFPQAGLVLAPRDIIRADELVGMAQQTGLRAIKRTAIDPSDLSTVDVVVLDTIGELGKIYGIGDIIYVGGSLIAHGGHNILEPAAHGKPILVGPHMFNFKDTYALLSGRGACLTVYDADELARETIRILSDQQLRGKMSQEALKIIAENRGAAKSSITFLKQLLTATASRSIG